MTVISVVHCQNCTFFSRQHPGENPLLKQLFTEIDGKRYSTVNNGYTYHFGVCASAEINPSGQSKGDIPFKDAGIVQTKVETIDEKHVLGLYTQADIKLGTDWLLLEYWDGDSYTSTEHCNKSQRMSIVMVSCLPGEPTGIFVFLGEENNKDRNCYYLFELKIGAICASNSDTGLSVGSILCIVMLCLAGVYLLLGFLYQRFMKGAQGYEQIPNYYMWRELGNLSADGCSYVFRSDGDTSGPRQYRGIDGNNLPESQEITRDNERDDQLLNM